MSNLASSTVWWTPYSCCSVYHLRPSQHWMHVSPGKDTHKSIGIVKTHWTWCRVQLDFITRRNRNLCSPVNVPVREIARFGWRNEVSASTMTWISDDRSHYFGNGRDMCGSRRGRGYWCVILKGWCQQRKGGTQEEDLPNIFLKDTSSTVAVSSETCQPS